MTLAAPDFSSLTELNTDDGIQTEEFGERLIVSGTELRRFLLSVRKVYGNIGEPDDLMYYFHLTCRLLRRIEFKYDLVVKKVPMADADRTSPMLSGPLFTSEDHPWPILNEALAEPIAQIDLLAISGHTKKWLGSGFLQLWVHPHSDEYMLKEIPREDIRSDALSSAPTPLNRNSFGQTPFGEWDGLVNLITGYGERIICYPDLLRDCCEDLATYLSPEHAKTILEFAQFLKPLKRPNTHFILGACDPIQYTAGERPPNLVALNDAYPFGWGDAGNAQIFYSTRPDSSVKFSFDWSCG